jgi:hypothetical protein
LRRTLPSNPATNPGSPSTVLLREITYDHEQFPIVSRRRTRNALRTSIRVSVSSVSTQLRSFSTKPGARLLRIGLCSPICRCSLNLDDLPTSTSCSSDACQADIIIFRGRLYVNLKTSLVLLLTDDEASVVYGFGSLRWLMIYQLKSCISFVLTLHLEQKCSCISDLILACTRFNILAMPMSRLFSHNLV